MRGRHRARKAGSGEETYRRRGPDQDQLLDIFQECDGGFREIGQPLHDHDPRAACQAWGEGVA